MKKQRLLGLLSAAVIAVVSLPSASLTVSADANVGDVLRVGNGQNQYKGNCDGYSYEIWLDNTGGSGSMTLGKGATFKAEWSASVSRGNYLARRGLSFGSTKKATDYPYIGMDYEASYQQTGSMQGNSRLCVYGWFQNQGAAGNPPLVEYYIIEDWIDWCPDGQGKMVTIDGAQYKIFKLHHDGPSINQGVNSFEQYFSVRQSKRKSGHITVSEHFKAWANEGWGIGNLYEVALNAEGYQSSGTANITKLDVYTTPPDPSYTTPGDGPVQTTPPADTVKYTAPSGSGTSISDDFEGSGTLWKTRGEQCDYGFTEDMANGGKKSLYVTGRTDYWNGFSASGSELKAGGSYNIEAYVAQKSGSSQPFTLGLQYNASGSSQPTYDNLFKESAASGKFTKIGGSFTIPSGATDISLYVQCGSEGDTSNCPFYLDDVKFTSDGSSPTVTDAPYTPPSSQTSSGSYPYTPGGTKFRDIFGPYFRTGTCLTATDLGKYENYLKENYNSITLENEMKPQNLLDQGACQRTGTTQITLNSCANVLSFCEKNGIGVRGHTFVWYSQTPDWFFKEGFQSNGAYVSKDVMDKRLEDMIKNTFAAIKQNYPKLDLYAYDVCNELFLNDGGGLRKKDNYQRPGDSYGSGGSDWAKVYGEDNNEFIIKAFKYARQYAPAGCKLYMNDYNEYMPDKRDDLVNMAKAILKEGPYIDGIGMQSHLSDGYPDAKTYEDAILAFSALGLDVQVTELDITKDSGSDSKWEQAYEDIYKVILKHADKISSVTLWGISDNHSWRGSKSPLLWTSGPTPKAIYQKVCDLTKQYPAPSPVVETTTAPIVTTAAPTQTTAVPVTTAAPTQTTTAPSQILKPTKLGDVDLSGDVDVSDAVLLARFINGDKVNVKDQGQVNADFNQDNKKDNKDVLAIIRWIAGFRD